MALDAAKEVIGVAGLIEPNGTSLETLIQNLPPEIVAQLGTLIFLAKTVGIILLIYIIFLTIKSIITIRNSSRIKTIYKKVHIIDEKLNRLLQEKEEPKTIKKIEKKKKKK